MPATNDSVGVFLAVIGSGLVVSGNSYITVQRQMQSGTALTTMRVSGATDYIGLKLVRSTPTPLTGGFYTQMQDDVEATMMVHYPYAGSAANTSSATTRLEQMVMDYKTTVFSGSLSGTTGFFISGLSAPILVGEAWPQAHEKAAKASLIYRTRYLM